MKYVKQSVLVIKHRGTHTLQLISMHRVCQKSHSLLCTLTTAPPHPAHLIEITGDELRYFGEQSLLKVLVLSL